MVGRERNVVKHLSEGELDRLQAEADKVKEYKLLTFLKRLYDGATLAATAEDVGISQATASNWVTRWNEGGLGKLTPNFGVGPPPKLDETEQQQLLERLRKGRPWKNKRYNISSTRNLNSEPVIESLTCEAAGFGDSVYKLQSPTKRSFGRRVLECSGYRDGSAV